MHDAAEFRMFQSMHQTISAVWVRYVHIATRQ
jgi:hypothetical protein